MADPTLTNPIYNYRSQPYPRRAPTAAATPATEEQKSAKAALDATLAQYGLGSLGTWAWDQFLNGSPIEQIMLDLRSRPEYKARFPAMDALSKKGRAISEAQYIAYERDASSMFRQYGLPAGFYDQPDDFGRFLANDVSLSELNDRIKLAATVAYQTPPQDRMELERLYGIGSGDLIAVWLDETKALPLLQQRFVSGQIAGASRESGYGTLTREEAEALGVMGVSREQASQGFGQLSGMRELFNPLDAGETAIDRETQLGAAFGSDAAAKETIEKRGRRRKAAFEGGSGFGSGQRGVGGLGSAAT